MFGHVDVVHHADPDTYRSRLVNGRICGPGTGDMKGIVAILLELFRFFHLQSRGVPLALAITTDEELGGMNGTRALVEEHGLRCKVGLVPDGGSLEEVVVEEKGILHLHLEATGVACHAARPWLGHNALAQILAALERIGPLFPPRHAPDFWHCTCAVTSVSTPNRSINRVPSHASASLDIRYPHPVRAAELIDRVQQVLPAGVTARPVITAEPSRLSPDPAFFDACEAVLGRRPSELREHGGSDARFIAARGIPVIMSRPRCGNLHSEDEWIEIDSMVQFFEIYRRYLTQRFA
jgi:succinyl-diaminopimelate desuccinylase